MVATNPRRTSLIRFIGAFVILSYSGCEQNQLGHIDLEGNPPLLGVPLVSPASINIDTITPVNGNYTVATTVTVSVSDPDGSGDLSTVEANVYRPSGESPFHQQLLHDDGVAPDLLAGDSVFSAMVQFDLTRPLSGPYRIELLARDTQGLRSNAGSVTFFTTRRNSIPVLSNLLAPDTVTVPPSGSIIVQMTITAADSDGLADVREVYFLSPDGMNPTLHFPLKDDGGLDPDPLFGPSGDSIAGDGIFSHLILLSDSPTVRGTYRFFFHARDTFGDTSATVLHFFTIQ